MWKVKVTRLCPTLRTHRLYSPWNSPGQNTGVGSLSLLQWIFPTQGSNPGLPLCRWILYQLSHQGSPLSPGVCSNSCSLNWWWHPTFSLSAAPFSSCPQFSPASGFFPMSWLIVSGGYSTGASASASVLPLNTQGWFPLGLTGLISLQSKGLLRVFSNTTISKHQFFGTQFSLWSSSHSHTWLEKPQLWLYGPLLAKWCLWFLIHLSRFVIAFLPRSKYLLISLLQLPSSVMLEPKKIKSITVSIVSPSICHEVIELDAMIFVFWMLSFKPAFFTLLIHPHREAL